MELWQQCIVNKWERLNNGEVMGYEVARKAHEIAEFFKSLNFLYYDHYGTRDFSNYVESMIRGYQCNNNAYEDMSITTTLDLHDVMCSSYGLHDFDNYICERWRDYFRFAIEQGI